MLEASNIHCRRIDELHLNRGAVSFQAPKHILRKATTSDPYSYLALNTPLVSTTQQPQVMGECLSTPQRAPDGRAATAMKTHRGRHREAKANKKREQHAMEPIARRPRQSKKDRFARGIEERNRDFAPDPRYRERGETRHKGGVRRE